MGWAYRLINNTLIKDCCANCSGWSRSSNGTTFPEIEGNGEGSIVVHFMEITRQFTAENAKIKPIKDNC